MSKIITNNITPRSGSSVGLTGDLTASGNITGVGGTFSGPVSGTTGTFTGNVSVGGTLTYEDVTNVDSVGVITARSDVSIADKIIHTGDTNTAIRFPAADTFTVETGGSEALRVDSSQRLLVGNTSPRSNAPGADVGFQIEGASGGPTNKRFTQHIFGSGDGSGPYVGLAKHRGTSVGGNTIVVNGDELGGIYFQGADGTNFKQGASILGFVDGTPGTNDMPGRLIFSTTADGASSPTERLRITSAGAAIFKGGLAEKYENAGTTLGAQSANPLSDGNVILFTGNESGNKTINFTGVHATLSNGETVSFTAIITPNNSGVINVVQVDGQAITVKWSGGSVPTAGASGQDIYTFQILKTGTGTSDYTVFGAATNYA